MFRFFNNLLQNLVRNKRNFIDLNKFSIVIVLLASILNWFVIFLEKNLHSLQQFCSEQIPEKK